MYEAIVILGILIPILMYKAADFIFGKIDRIKGRYSGLGFYKGLAIKVIRKRWKTIQEILDLMESNIKNSSDNKIYRNIKYELDYVKEWVENTDNAVNYIDNGFIEQIFIQNRMIYNIKNLIIFCEDLENKDCFKDKIKEINLETDKINNYLERYNYDLESYELCCEKLDARLLNKLTRDKYKIDTDRYVDIYALNPAEGGCEM